jgi:PadR family transcriptional regulator, regulatory protein AphA
VEYQHTNPAVAIRPLSANDAAVLGLLANREISGYELDKLIRNTVGFFWTPVKSHVYTTLARLVEAGYTSAREVEQTTRPDKRLYRITPAGEAALRRWLDHSPLEPARFKNSFLLKVFLGRHMDGDALVRHIEEGRADVEEELSQLEAIERDADPERDLYGWLALTYGLERDRATIRWADEALRALRERGDRP